MGDGYLNLQDGKGMVISNVTLDLSQICTVCQVLGEKYGLQCTPKLRTRDNKREYSVYISAHSADAFVQLVKPYMLPSFYYKLPKMYRDT
jgi:hypothetical protein